MTTDAKATYGTKLARATNEIAELTNIGSPKLKLNTEDATNHQSPDGYKEVIATILEAGDVAIEGNFISSDTNGQIGLVTDMNAKTLQDFVITFPDGTTWTFKAYVTEFEIGKADTKGKMTFSASLTITGKPVLGITAAPNLTGLVVTTGTLIPAFAGTTYVYVANIATDQASVTITPTCAAADSIEVDDNTVASGVPSSAVTLGLAGSVTTVEVVTKDAGKADAVYTVHLTREGA